MWSGLDFVWSEAVDIPSSCLPRPELTEVWGLVAHSFVLAQSHVDRRLKNSEDVLIRQGQVASCPTIPITNARWIRSSLREKKGDNDVVLGDNAVVFGDWCSFRHQSKSGMLIMTIFEPGTSTSSVKENAAPTIEGSVE